MNEPTRDDDSGVVTAYGAALGPLLVMALRPIKAANAAAYRALLEAVRKGDLHLRLVTTIGIGAPGELVLVSLDRHGTEVVLSSLVLDSVVLN